VHVRAVFAQIGARCGRRIGDPHSRPPGEVCARRPRGSSWGCTPPQRAHRQSPHSATRRPAKADGNEGRQLALCSCPDSGCSGHVADGLGRTRRSGRRRISTPSRSPADRLESAASASCDSANVRVGASSAARGGAPSSVARSAEPCADSRTRGIPSCRRPPMTWVRGQAPPYVVRGRPGWLLPGRGRLLPRCGDADRRTGSLETASLRLLGRRPDERPRAEGRSRGHRDAGASTPALRPDRNGAAATLEASRRLLTGGVASGEGESDYVGTKGSALRRRNRRSCRIASARSPGASSRSVSPSRRSSPSMSPRSRSTRRVRSSIFAADGARPATSCSARRISSFVSKGTSLLPVYEPRKVSWLRQARVRDIQVQNPAGSPMP
jgi:hypothetical protein